MRDARDVIIEPVISEKSYDKIEENKYTFKVHPKAKKTEIRHAVENIFGVSVTKVNTMKKKGKARRRGYTTGRTASWKKAIVTLKEGEKIEFFEGA